MPITGTKRPARRNRWRQKRVKAKHTSPLLEIRLDSSALKRMREVFSSFSQRVELAAQALQSFDYAMPNLCPEISIGYTSRLTPLAQSIYYRNVEGVTLVVPAEATSQCHTCAYHHGQSYGGNHLVCALHPSGPEGECGDWEKK